MEGLKANRVLSLFLISLESTGIKAVKHLFELRLGKVTF